MVKYVEFSVESPTSHRGKDSARPIVTSYKEHSYQICVSPVSVHVCAGFEISDLHGQGQSSVLIFNHVDVPNAEEEQMHELIRHTKVTQGMHQVEYRRSYYIYRPDRQQ